MSLQFFLCCFWLVGALFLSSQPAQAALHVGDILVVDTAGGTNGNGALVQVDPQTGHRSILTDFGNPAQGNPLAVNPTGVAVTDTGQLYVSCIFTQDPPYVGVLFQVDPDTGNRTLIKDLADTQGILYYGLALNAKNQVIGNSFTTLVRINPDTKDLVLVTDLANPIQGVTDSDRFITDLTTARSGQILIGTARITAPGSALFKVNPVTGKRNLLSDFTNPAQGTDVADLFYSTGMAVDASGQILVNSGGSVWAPRNLLLRIDSQTGKRTVLSDYDNPGQGVTGLSIRGLAVEKSGSIIVGSGNVATEAADTTLLFRVSPNTGLRTLLSDSNNPEQGPAFSSLTNITIVPPPPANRLKENNAESQN